ncbi:MAG TPA: tetratricopeptide repeat protein [Puia sp.]|nr:tetratricopeptide repeat protein [Puia sp.]
MNRSTAVLLLASLLTCLCTHAQKDSIRIASGELLQKGDSLYDSSQYQRAIQTFNQVEPYDTNYVRALYGISLCYYADSQYDKSAEYCRKALALNEDAEKWPDIINHYGNSLDVQEKHEEAMRIYDSGMHKYPAYGFFYLNKGATLIGMKRYADAEKVLQQGLMVSPYTYSLYFKLGAAALNQGKLVPATLCFTAYLLMTPEGRHHSSCISFLSAISKNKDNIRELVDERKIEPDENYRLLEEIIQSKIALDKNYKPIPHLDDPISRQIQVLFEKMEYNEADSDFYMQYFIPYFKSVYTGGQFENFVNHIFSGVDIDVIQDYVKKNKKSIDALTSQAADYFDLIRSTRELTYTKRSIDNATWFYYDGGIDSHGKYITKEKKTIGPWEFYYKAGNLKSKGSYTNEGKKDGPWTYYYANGEVKGKEIYHNGSQEGEETYYFSNGAPSSHSWYKNNALEGESVEYFFCGGVKTITHYHAGKEEGQKISFNTHGDTSLLENYVAGEQQGEVRSWTNGKIDVIAAYKDGKLDGPYKKYYSSGLVKMEGAYQGGNQIGDWKQYHPNGQLKSIQHFVNDKSEGEYKEYFEDGTLGTELVQKGGKTYGDAKYYDYDGKLFSIYSYTGDHIQKVRYFDKKGSIISTTERSTGPLDLTQYYPDGSKKNQATYNEKENITGVETFFYPSGHVLETDDYADGDLQGYSLAYYPNGAKKAETHYVNGKMDGYHCSYYQHGQKKEEGWYSGDNMAGTWVAYNELGALTDSTYYLNGEYHGYKSSFWPDGRKEELVKYRSGWIQEYTQYDSTGKVLTYVVFHHGNGQLQTKYPDGRTYQKVGYKQGEIDGPRTFYYPDGKILAEDKYVNGLIEGPYKSYGPNGLLNTEGQFSRGDRTGMWKYYDFDGKLQHTVEYRFNKMDGKEVWYYKNGKPETETQYKEDVRNGVYKSFDPDGTLLYQVTFRDDHPISYSYLDKKDSLVPAIPLTGWSGKIKTYFPNGNVSAEVEYKDGLLDGVYKLYHTNGKLRVEKHRNFGALEGPFTEYYPNGQIASTGVYVHDDIHGLYKEFNDKGQPTEEWTYYLDSLNGRARIFDDKGKVSATYIYYFGRPISVKNESTN